LDEAKALAVVKKVGVLVASGRRSSGAKRHDIYPRAKGDESAFRNPHRPTFFVAKIRELSR
jgi:hypothetical protein